MIVLLTVIFNVMVEKCYLFDYFPPAYPQIWHFFYSTRHIILIIMSQISTKYLPFLFYGICCYQWNENDVCLSSQWPNIENMCPRNLTKNGQSDLYWGLKIGYSYIFGTHPGTSITHRQPDNKTDYVEKHVLELYGLIIIYTSQWSHYFRDYMLWRILMLSWQIANVIILTIPVVIPTPLQVLLLCGKYRSHFVSTVLESELWCASAIALTFSSPWAFKRLVQPFRYFLRLHSTYSKTFLRTFIAFEHSYLAVALPTQSPKICPIWAKHPPYWEKGTWQVPVSNHTVTYHSDITCTSRRCKSPATRLFLLQPIPAYNKGNIEAPHHWPFVRGIHL